MDSILLTVPHFIAQELRRFWSGGVAGNARLTATAGSLLLLLLAVEGFTILAIRPLFSVHAFVGLLLIPPILLKLSSTGYRFTLYYARSARYRQAGPPQLLPRLTAPFLVAATLGLFATGVILLIAGPKEQEPWRGLHTLFFFGWFWLMSAHVLTYLGRATRLTASDLRGLVARAQVVSGAMTRQNLVLGSVLLGFAFAIAALPLDNSWVHFLGTRRPDR